MLVRIVPPALVALLLVSCTQPPPAAPPEFPVGFNLNDYERHFGYSQAVRAGRTLYVSATMPVDAEGRLVGPGGIGSQLEAAYVNLAATLEAHDVGFDRVVLERIYTTDMAALLPVLDRRRKVYTGAHHPALTVVEVRRLLDPAFLVAIEAVVELPEPRESQPVRP
jgi:enamine deaminase RidA (YjgF/YER057c/UK114 family)